MRNASHKNPVIVSDEDFASIAVGQNIILSKRILIYDILESVTDTMDDNTSSRGIRSIDNLHQYIYASIW